MRDLLSGVEKIASCLLLAILAGTIFIQVLSRFVFNFPLAWSEEASRYSFIWLTMIAAPLCIRGRANIGMDVLTRFLPRRGTILVEIATSTLVFVLCAALFIWGCRILPVVSSQMSPAIGIPMAWIYAAVPTGAVLMIVELLYSIRFAIGRYRGGDEGVSA